MPPRGGEECCGLVSDGGHEWTENHHRPSMRRIEAERMRVSSREASMEASMDSSLKKAGWHFLKSRRSGLL